MQLRDLSYSSVFGCFQDLGVPDSPSSMRVNRGSNTMVYIDEDTDAESEPRLLRHDSLHGDDEPVEVVESPVVAKKIHLLGDGEVQKIVKSEDEDEIVVVDDYLEDKEAAATARPDNVGTGEEAGSNTESQIETSNSQQKENDLAEAAQENSQMAREMEAKTDQAMESATGEQENAKENDGKETDDKSPEEKEKEGDEHSSEKKTEGGEEKKENEDADEKKQSGDADSDDGFIELRPESERVQDAERVTSQVNPQPKVEGASGGDKDTIPENPAETEQRIDIQQYYLRKKPSVPPALPPKEKHYY